MAHRSHEASNSALMDLVHRAWLYFDLCLQLLKSTQDANPRVRATSAWLIGEFCAGTPHNITDQIPRIFKDLLPRLNDAGEFYCCTMRPFHHMSVAIKQ